MGDFQEIRDMIDREKAANAFVFLPSPILDVKDSFFMPLAETVLLRQDEIYEALGKYRIHFNGLLRLSAAACMKWGVDNTKVVSLSQAYCAFKAVGGVLRADGTIQWHGSTKDWDLEVIMDELTEKYSNGWEKGDKKKWPYKDFKAKDDFVSFMVRRDSIQSKKNKLTITESGAKARVIRSVLGLQGTYSNENQLIDMPFIMIHYAQNPNHPQVKQHLLNELGTSQNMIYGNQARQNQIAYYDKDAETQGEIIDLAPEDGIDQNQGTDTKETAPAGTTDGYNPGAPDPAAKKFEPKRENRPGNIVDFGNSDIDEQVKILKDLCIKAGDDFEAYNKDPKNVGGVAGLDQEWRNGYFEWLLAEIKKEKK